MEHKAAAWPLAPETELLHLILLQRDIAAAEVKRCNQHMQYSGYICWACTDLQCFNRSIKTASPSELTVVLRRVFVEEGGRSYCQHTQIPNGRSQAVSHAVQRSDTCFNSVHFDTYYYYVLGSSP